MCKARTTVQGQAQFVGQLIAFRSTVGQQIAGGRGHPPKVRVVLSILMRGKEDEQVIVGGEQGARLTMTKARLLRCNASGTRNWNAFGRSFGTVVNWLTLQLN